MLQGAALGSCQVSVVLHFSLLQLKFTELLDHHAEQVACISARLQEKYGTQICIILRGAQNAPHAPTPFAIQHLAPFLYHMDYYTIPDQHISDRSQLAAVSQSNMTVSHVWALQQAATSLQSLCMGIRREDTAPLSAAIEAMSSLTHLTRMHLTLITSAADFGPLSQLCHLKDIGLQCCCQVACCQGVLSSCKDSLHIMTLAAVTWDAATYSALGCIHQLDMLTIKVDTMAVDQAEQLQNVRATLFEVGFFACGHMQPAAMQMLATVGSNVHSLTLWKIDDVCCQHMHHLPCLRKLTVIDSPHLTGTTFQVQPTLLQLIFIGSCDVNAEGLYHMLKLAFPALKSLSITSPSNDAEALVLQLDTQAMQMLSLGQNLEELDLRGLRGLSNASIAVLHRAFHWKQLCGQAQSHIALQAKQNSYPYSTRLGDNFMFPNFFVHSNPFVAQFSFNQSIGPGQHQDYLSNAAFWSV